LSDCPQEKMGVLGKYCAECVYEREDQERLHFQGNINGRELLRINANSSEPLSFVWKENYQNDVLHRGFMPGHNW